MLRRLLPIMFILVFIFLLVLPAFAQDATVESTPESTPNVTMTAPAPVDTHASSLFSPATIGELLLFLGLSGLAGGGIVAIILSFLGKKEVRDRVEDARNSWSPEQQQVLANFTSMFERTAGGILDFLKAVQDGKPNVVGQPQITIHANSPEEADAAARALMRGIKNASMDSNV